MYLKVVVPRNPVLLIVVGAGVLTLVISVVYLHTLPANNTRSLLVYTSPTLYSLVSEYAEIFERDFNVEVHVSAGPTGALINRVEITRRGDILLTSDHVFMENAISRGLVEKGTVRVVSYIVPAIAVPRGNPHNISGILDLVEKPLKIGIADPEVAPFGRIAVEILKRAGVYESVKDRLVVYGDVAQVARQLVLGQVDVAILPYIVKYWYPGEVDLVWLSPGEIRGLVSCQLVAIIVYSENRELAELFIEGFTAWLREKNSTLGLAASLEDLAELTPYTPSSLEFPEVCLGR